MSRLALAIGGSLLLVASPLSAQNLTWFGTSGCFTSASSSPVNRYVLPACDINASTSHTISWDSNNSSNDRSHMHFSINEYNNSGSANDWPGGPLSGSTNRTLTFGSIGAISNIYLAYFEFDRDEGEDLVSTNLSLKLAFNGGTASYIDQFSIITENVSGTGDGIRFTANPWMDFTIGSYSYSFRVSGLDSPYSNDDAEYCDDRDYTPAVSFGGDVSGKLCGQVRYNGLAETSTTTVTPEPSTYVLMAAGLMGVGVVARRRRAA